MTGSTAPAQPWNSQECSNQAPLDTSRPSRLFQCVTSLAACGGGNDPSAADGGGSGTEQEACATSFLPLKTGLKWTYQVRDLTGGGTETKETTVEDAGAGVQQAVADGLPRRRPARAARWRTRRSAGSSTPASRSPATRSSRIRPAQGGAAPTPTLLEWWEPYKLRIDESKLRKGDKWAVTYKEYSRNNGVDAMPRDRNESWEVMGVNEMLTNAAGTFKALHLRRVGTDQNATSDKQYWFACGVGKVRESGAGGRFEEA